MASIGKMMMLLERIVLAKPRGFCAGVERAIEIVEQVLRQHGAPVYVKHEIVHNRHVVEDFCRRGVHFIETPQEAPPGAVLIYSAHGVSRKVRRQAESRGQRIYDATCPLVTKIHSQIVRLRAAGNEVIMIGHRGHPEVEGALGQCEDGMYLVENEADVESLKLVNPRQAAFVTQTTLSVDDTAQLTAKLRHKFPHIRAPRRDDICYATQNRQNAIKKLATQCDVVLVVGSAASSNSNRLCEVAALAGGRAYRIDSADDIKMDWLADVAVVGITAGASAPEELVQGVVAWLHNLNPECRLTEMDGEDEHVVFMIPKSLARGAALSS